MCQRHLNLLTKYRKYSNCTMKLNEAKKVAAVKAIDDWVTDKTAIGIGSGSTVVFAVQRLAQKVKTEGLQVICVPTSFQARQLCCEHKLQLGELDRYPSLSLVIDGADEVDESKTLIKGGGGCLLQEKVIASCAENMIVIADYTKKSRYLGEQYKKGIPIEVIPMAYMPILNKIQNNFGGIVHLRSAISKAGPCVTDNGNFILDWKFDSTQSYNWERINNDIKLIPGVVEIGLFVQMATKIYYGMPDGTVVEQD